jgi:asparagine synthetase B (glutamine-hydrolysing)
MTFSTENDSEVAAGYLTWRMSQGASLRDSLSSSLNDLDGFFTFVVGTRNGFAVLRDPIACKPAIMAESDDYVAFGSEYRALSVLPNIDNVTDLKSENYQSTMQRADLIKGTLKNIVFDNRRAGRELSESYLDPFDGTAVVIHRRMMTDSVCRALRVTVVSRRCRIVATNGRSHRVKPVPGSER